MLVLVDPAEGRLEVEHEAPKRAAGQLDLGMQLPHHLRGFLVELRDERIVELVKLVI